MTKSRVIYSFAAVLLAIAFSSGSFVSAQTETPTTPTAYAYPYNPSYYWRYRGAAQTQKAIMQIAHDLQGIATAAGYTEPILTIQSTPTPTPTLTPTVTRTPTVTPTPTNTPG
jgi:hypothetical protein